MAQAGIKTEEHNIPSLLGQRLQIFGEDDW